MKKYFVWAVLCMAMLTVVLCSCSEDEETTIKNGFYGQEWTTDASKASFRFYRNHMVECHISGKGPQSGQMSFGSGIHLGTWRLEGNMLNTTFVPEYPSGDKFDYLFGSLMISESEEYFFKGTDADGDTHSFYSNNQKWFTDYTDDSIHDHALVGTWHTDILINDIRTTATMTIDTKGEAVFEYEGFPMLRTVSASSTKNGCVTFSDYLVEQDEEESFLYIREKESITFYDTTKNGIKRWTWTII